MNGATFTRYSWGWMLHVSNAALIVGLTLAAASVALLWACFRRWTHKPVEKPE